MSQSDFILADALFPAFFTDLNLMVKALASLSEGTTEPTTTYASQLWVDSDNNILYLRSKDNTAWIPMADIDYSNDRMQWIANIFTAASTAGLTFKASGGDTIGTMSDAGLWTQAMAVLLLVGRCL